jgi:adenosylcobyric acid synthase
VDGEPATIYMEGARGTSFNPAPLPRGVVCGRERVGLLARGNRAPLPSARTRQWDIMSRSGPLVSTEFMPRDLSRTSDSGGAAPDLHRLPAYVARSHLRLWDYTSIPTAGLARPPRFCGCHRPSVAMLLRGSTRASTLRPMTESLPPLGRVLMVQGTASHAGKSTFVAALCRIYAQAGYRVAPFKAQNMSNNAAVTDDGREVGRAQAVQAMAAGIPVTVDMNPVLLKPQSDLTSQIVVLGRPRHVAGAYEYYDLKNELWPVVTGALDRLRAAYDLVILEGAGSPAEINLAQYDIVNMRIARYAGAPVLLVGDIDRGGVFASLYGTVALLQPEERALVRGFIINKFRGDSSLLAPGFEMMRERTGIPTLGVLPYLDLSRLPEEDALNWEWFRRAGEVQAVIDIAVMRLPRVANLDEFQPLACEPGVRLRFIGSGDELGEPDLIVIPGTKSTLADLAWLRERGLDEAIRERLSRRIPILGICGGFQMLGDRLIDEHGAEARGGADGLGLLPVTTVFSPEKVTRRVSVRVAAATALCDPASDVAGTASARATRRLGDALLDAYEIHMGRTYPSACRAATDLGAAPFVVTSTNGTDQDGISSTDGLVVGTYLHGLLENDSFRRALVGGLAARKGVHLPPAAPENTIDRAFDALAAAVRKHVDLSAIDDMVGLPRPANSQ